MPTQKPRISITLEPHVAAAIHDLADAVGKPAATVVAQLLEEMAQQISDLATINRAALAGNRSAVKAALRNMVGDTVAELMIATQGDLLARKPRKTRKAAKT